MSYYFFLGLVSAYEQKHAKFIFLSHFLGSHFLNLAFSAQNHGWMAPFCLIASPQFVSLFSHFIFVLIHFTLIEK
jgi:hypothetical protein